MSEYNKERRLMIKVKQTAENLDTLVNNFVKAAAFTSARSKANIVSQFMKETKQKAVRIGDILFEIDKDSGVLTYYKPKPKSLNKIKEQTAELNKWIEAKEKEDEESKRPISEEEGIELGVLKPSSELEDSTQRAVDLMTQIVTEAGGDQDILQMTVDLSKLVDNQDFPGSFDLLKNMAKKTDSESVHSIIIELAHVIADIRNDIQLME